MWLKVFNFGFILLFVSIVGYIGFQSYQDKTIWHPAELVTIDHLMDIYYAEWRWKESDWDSNAEYDFWTRDLAGLYFYKNPKSGRTVSLIPRSLAEADALAYPHFYIESKIEHKPLKGYIFQALTYDTNGLYLAKEDPSTRLHYRDNQFAFIALPVLQSNLKTFLINEKRQILYKNLGTSKTPNRWPSNPLREGWELLQWKN